MNLLNIQEQGDITALNLNLSDKHNVTIPDDLNLLGSQKSSVYDKQQKDVLEDTHRHCSET